MFVLIRSGNLSKFREENKGLVWAKRSEFDMWRIALFCKTKSLFKLDLLAPDQIIEQ